MFDRSALEINGFAVDIEKSAVMNMIDTFKALKK